jgi:predicted oxidoreductase
MQQLKLHPEGPIFSRIIAGAWRWHTVSGKTFEQLVKTSLEQGINAFDHAAVYGDYGNEKIFGDFIARESSTRDKMKLITKCGIQLLSKHRPKNRIKHYDTSKEHIVESAENSLRLLQTDHIDLLLIHRPDPLMSPQGVAEAFSKLKQEGKVLHFGVSNFTTGQFDLLQSNLSFPLVTNQIEISLGRIDSLFNGDVDLLMKHKASPMAWSPLAGSKLMTEERTWFSMATKYNATYSQLALAWLLKHPSSIFPIIGTTQPERVIECSNSTELELDRQDWFEMLKWVVGKDVA